MKKFSLKSQTRFSVTRIEHFCAVMKLTFSCEKNEEKIIRKLGIPRVWWFIHENKSTWLKCSKFVYLKSADDDDIYRAVNFIQYKTKCRKSVTTWRNYEFWQFKKWSSRIQIQHWTVLLFSCVFWHESSSALLISDFFGSWNHHRPNSVTETRCFLAMWLYTYMMKYEVIEIVTFRRKAKIFTELSLYIWYTAHWLMVIHFHLLIIMDDSIAWVNSVLLLINNYCD